MVLLLLLLYYKLEHFVYIPEAPKQWRMNTVVYKMLAVDASLLMTHL